jgi:hypothetical protein
MILKSTALRANPCFAAAFRNGTIRSEIRSGFGCYVANAKMAKQVIGPAFCGSEADFRFAARLRTLAARPEL